MVIFENLARILIIIIWTHHLITLLQFIKAWRTNHKLLLWLILLLLILLLLLLLIYEFIHLVIIEVTLDLGTYLSVI